MNTDKPTRDRTLEVLAENAALIFHLESTVNQVLSALRSCVVGDEVARIVKRCYESDDPDGEIDKYLEISQIRLEQARKDLAYYKHVETQKGDV